LVGSPWISEIFSPIVANQECCRTAGSSNAGDVRALGIIAMLLMQKYPTENGDLGVEDTKRWPLDSDPVKFLTETNTAKSARELLKVSDEFRHLWLASDLCSIPY
jgi:hypothetical protein